MAELADAQDLKSCDGKTSYRFDSGPRHHKKVGRSDAGWSSLVARRAHNPKVVGSNPAPATISYFNDCGGVAQLARACGSYPQCQQFKSVRRYHKFNKALWSSGLRHHPFTVVSRVRFPAGSPKCGRIAQLGEHLPYKQGVIGSSPIVPTTKN